MSSHRTSEEFTPFDDENAPRHSEQSYRAIIENSTDITMLVNTFGMVTYVSPSITPILGYAPEDVVGSHALAIIHPDDTESVQQMFGGLVQAPEKSLRAEYRLRCKDGSHRWFEGSETNLLQVPGIRAIVRNFRDITERKLAPSANWSEIDQAEHFVQFYETDEFLLESLNGFISTGLDMGETCIIVATEAHRAGLEERLKANGLDLAAIRSRGEYISLDAAETLSKFMVDGSPEPEFFAEAVGSIIEQAARGLRHVRIFGEMVSLLWIEGNEPAAIRLEELWNDLYHKTHSFSLLCAYAMHNFDGEGHGVQFTEICKQHSQVIPDESYSALTSTDERLRAISLLQQKAYSLEAEIAERKGAEERLRISEARKDEFISMASHELKTPVTSLKGFTHLLQQRWPSEGDAQTQLFLQRIEAQLNKLTKLINDMLDLSRIQTGMLTYHGEVVDLDALLHDTIEQLQAITPTHQLKCVGSTSAQVFGDRDRLGQVFINLLSNAVKYSPGADTVLITLSNDGDQTSLVSIQDFGIGIAEAYHERIFEHFYQVPDPLEKTFPGLGIGLYLAYQIIQRHEGRLWVESHKGKGATFHVSLPIRQHSLDVPTEVEGETR